MFLTILNYLKAYIGLCLLLLVATHTLAHGQMPLPLETIEALEAQQQNGFEIKPQDVSTFPSIEDDIKSLNEPLQAQAAIQRILARGEVSVPYLLELVKNPVSTYKLKATALSLMYQVSNAEHAASIIAATELIETQQRVSGISSQSRLFPYAYTFQWLEKIPSTSVVETFVNKQLEDKTRDPAIKVLALNYLALKPVKQSNQWFKLYTTPNTDMQLQYAAYYLGAMLGNNSLKNKLIELLKTIPEYSNEYKHQRFNLLKGLVEITTLEEFETITKKHNINVSDNNIQLYLLLKRDNSDNKQGIIDTAISKRNKDAEKIIHYLVSINDAEPLAIHWQVNNPWLRQRLKQRDLAMQVTEKKAAFIPFSQYQPLHKNNATPEQLASAVYNSLKENNQTAITDLTASDSRLIKLLEIKQLPALAESWQQLKRQAESAGLNWKTARLSSTHYKIMVANNRLQMTDIEVVLTNDRVDEQIQYVFVIRGCLYFAEQWHIAFPLQWRGKTNANI